MVYLLFTVVLSHLACLVDIQEAIDLECCNSTLGFFKISKLHELYFERYSNS